MGRRRISDTRQTNGDSRSVKRIRELKRGFGEYMSRSFFTYKHSLRFGKKLFVAAFLLLSLMSLLFLSGCDPNRTSASSMTGKGVPDYVIPTIEGKDIQLSQ